MLSEKLKCINNLQDLGVDGRIILKRMFSKKGGRIRALIDLGEARELWWAFVSAEMNS